MHVGRIAGCVRKMWGSRLGEIPWTFNDDAHRRGPRFKAWQGLEAFSSANRHLLLSHAPLANIGQRKLRDQVHLQILTELNTLSVRSKQLTNNATHPPHHLPVPPIRPRHLHPHPPTMPRPHRRLRIPRHLHLAPPHPGRPA